VRPCEVCSATSFAPLFEKAAHRFVRCARCGLERIDPQPTDATLAKIYGAHYYDAWGLHDDETTVRDLKRRTFTSILSRLGVPAPGARLIDCGAATGFLMEVAEGLGYRPYGVELSEFGATEIGRRFGADRAFCGELEAAEFADAPRGSFDVVTMCDLIEHVRDPEAALREALAFLRPGGALVITTPDAGSWSRRVLGQGWLHYKIEHLFYFSKPTIRSLLGRAGFAAVEFHPLVKSLTLGYIDDQLESYPHPVLTAISRAVRTIVPARVRTRPLPFLTGELLAIARSPGGAARRDVHGVGASSVATASTKDAS
jgi:SAM-dependent methyltransferase